MNAKEATEEWIQYLKNNQIVGLKANPETGRLVYRRPVHARDLQRFVALQYDLSCSEIDAMLAKVLSGGDSAIAPDDSGGLVDRPGPEISESDVLKLFSLVEAAVREASVAEAEKERLAEQFDIQRQKEGVQQDQLQRFLASVDDDMTKAQRLILANLIAATRDDRATLPTPRIRKIFASLSQRDKRLPIFSMFPSKPSGLTLDAIEQRWIAAGYPIDVNSIRAFLAAEGFDSGKVRTAFDSSESFDDTLDFEENYCPKALIKLAEFALKQFDDKTLLDVMEHARHA